MFAAQVFQRFVDHKALVEGSPVATLMNKAHHGKRQEIRAADVAQCADVLIELITIAEQMDEECFRWRRRDKAVSAGPVIALTPVNPPPMPRLSVIVCPDLAAFTDRASIGETQEPPEALNPALLENTSAYFLRRHNFGFAAPQGALAIVETIPTVVGDRRLVVARHGSAIYARRLVRPQHGNIIGLTAEIPDPRERSPKTIFLPEQEVALHRVVGIIFDHNIQVGLGREEATPVDASEPLKKIEIGYRVKDTSAVPLALEKQVVLGGAAIELADIGRYEGALAAIALDDGSHIFKRIGRSLSGKLSHLRQLEAIGGMGSSQVAAFGRTEEGLPRATRARVIVGVLYHG
jgi:hypothetical protein